MSPSNTENARSARFIAAMTAGYWARPVSPYGMSPNSPISYRRPWSRSTGPACAATRTTAVVPASTTSAPAMASVRWTVVPRMSMSTEPTTARRPAGVALVRTGRPASDGYMTARAVTGRAILRIVQVGLGNSRDGRTPVGNTRRRPGRARNGRRRTSPATRIERRTATFTSVQGLVTAALALGATVTAVWAAVTHFDDIPASHPAVGTSTRAAGGPPPSLPAAADGGGSFLSGSEPVSQDG